MNIVGDDVPRVGGGARITFVPGGPNEITTQLTVQADEFFERNETFLLDIFLSEAAMLAGGRVGPRNQPQVTIINDDCKINHLHLYIVKDFFCYSSGPSLI